MVPAICDKTLRTGALIFGVIEAWFTAYKIPSASTMRRIVAVRAATTCTGTIGSASFASFCRSPPPPAGKSQCDPAHLKGPSSTFAVLLGRHAISNQSVIVRIACQGEGALRIRYLESGRFSGFITQQRQPQALGRKIQRSPQRSDLPARHLRFQVKTNSGLPAIAAVRGSVPGALVRGEVAPAGRGFALLPIPKTAGIVSTPCATDPKII